jgi:hypothetical protein
MPLPPKLTARRGNRRSVLGDLIVRLASDSGGEVVATAYALTRALKAAGVDYHDLVAHIEQPAQLSDRQIEKIEAEMEQRERLAYSHGLVEGKRQARFEVVDFPDAPGTDNWRQKAIFVDGGKDRLRGRDRSLESLGFIGDMASRARRTPFYQPSEAQMKWLNDLYRRCGGPTS